MSRSGECSLFRTLGCRLPRVADTGQDAVMPARTPVLLAALITAAGIAAAACAPAPANNAAPPSGVLTPGQGACSPGQLHTLKSGTFTLGTDEPVYSPWFVNDDPSNGKGFES